MEEWQQLGQDLLESSPATYHRVLGALRELVAAERKLATTDIAVLIEVLRTRFSSSTNH